MITSSAKTIKKIQVNDSYMETLLEIMFVYSKYVLLETKSQVETTV